jgi:rare lipoprotein A
MTTWRMIAATAALCLFAQSPTASADPAQSPGHTTHNKKHSALHQLRSHNKSQKLAGQRRSRRYATRAKSRHPATRLAGPATSGAREFSGKASYYWEGSRVATGARYNPDGLTAAHRTLPFGTRLHVTDLISKKSVDVIINDRGPFIAGRILDLSRGAAVVLGMTGRGVTPIKATVL